MTIETEWITNTSCFFSLNWHQNRHKYLVLKRSTRNDALLQPRKSFADIFMLFYDIFYNTSVVYAGGSSSLYSRSKWARIDLWDKFFFIAGIESTSCNETPCAFVSDLWSPVLCSLVKFLLLLYYCSILSSVIYVDEWMNRPSTSVETWNL